MDVNCNLRAIFISIFCNNQQLFLGNFRIMNVILGKAPEPFHSCKLLSVNTKLKFINIKILFRRLQEVAEAFF